MVLPLMMGQQTPFYVKNKDRINLTEEGALHFSSMALNCLDKEYPNKLNQVLKDGEMLQAPSVLHPAFYGCFDWHSSVHGHWMLVRILKLFPSISNAEEIRSKLSKRLTRENIAGEINYFSHASKSWERTYGWAWLLKLAEELQDWEDLQGQEWYEQLKPLANVVVQRYIDFLPIQSYPVRTGVHPNTAFGLSFAYDYAQRIGDLQLSSLIEARAMHYFSADRNCPSSWEPSGEDFLSPCLEEALLMAKILPTVVFEDWMGTFLPTEQIKVYAEAVDVSDRSDPKIVHLDGLNLSRAWCLLQLYGLSNNRESDYLEYAYRHLNQSIPYVLNDYYEGSHWLASFAIYALSQQSVKEWP